MVLLLSRMSALLKQTAVLWAGVYRSSCDGETRVVAS